ncbi:hypothetical protein [Streptomyces sp. NPDC127084]|uniref:hypothetical protein n=1 Tax=Streptomyces sp. NPDC127084 TaxID=3347133 RepID=UPI003656E946
MPTTIAGRVTTESGQGVARLNVAFYEIGQSATPTKYAAAPGQGTERVGSALTDEDGRFLFAWDEPAALQGITSKDAPKSGQRQVAVLVLPPHRPVPEKGKEPATLWQTVIYGLRYGGTETLSIQLPRQTLREAGALREPAEILAEELSEDWTQQQRMNTFLAPTVKEQISARVKAVQKGQDFARKLAALPAATRKDRLFLGAGTTLEAAQKAGLEAGLQRLAQFADAGHGTVQLHFTDAQLIRKGLDVASWADRSRPIRITSLCPLLEDRTEGPVLERLRGLLDPPPGDAPPAPAPPGDEPPPRGEDDAPTPQEEIIRQVLAQIRPLDGDGEGADTAAVFARLKKAVALLQPDSGTAETTAIRDVHALQMAFPHVWTEAFDERFRDAVGRLYGETVRLHEEYGLDLTWAGEAGDVRELERFLADLDDRREALTFLPPPQEVQVAFPSLSFAQWHALSCDQQAALRTLARRIRAAGTDAALVARLRREGQELIGSPAGPLGRAQKLILEARDRIREPYAFHYFAPDSVNYGILTTYRQELRPLTYQVGDLVATVPLAPGETRSVSVTERVKKSRAQREVESALMNQRDEIQRGSRAEDEIMRRASLSSNFQTSASGSLNFGIGQIGGTTGFSLNQADESSRVKRSAREDVARAAQEFRRDHTVEASTEESADNERVTSGTLSNPNNEITVTYLLYQLERQYKVRERIHRLTPVIMVAQDVPAPHEIDDDWLLAHAWILKRVLLDDGFQAAIDVLEDRFAGDELAVDIKRTHWNTQKDLVDRLDQSIHERMLAIEHLQELLVRATEGRDLAKVDEPDDVQRAAEAFFTGGWSLLFGGRDEDSSRLEAQRNALELRLQQLGESMSEARRQLAREVSTLEAATAAYTKAVEAQFNRRSRIDQLRVHVKQNILHYMQAIWAHEPPDQRFFRLYHKEVPVPQPDSRGCTIRRVRPDEESPRIFHRDGVRYIIECAPPVASESTRPLVEIADLDRPLGYKGNYILFPLKECVYLTDFMMLNYVDDYFGLRDPDPVGETPIEDLIALREQRGDELDEAARDALELMIARRLAGPRKEHETIVIPTGRLFMEALPGTAPLLEQFKQAHRALDVAKVRAELRSGELENLRYAARLLADEHADPEVDRQVVVTGGEVRVETDA